MITWVQLQRWMGAILSKVEPLCDYCISLSERLDNDETDREAWVALKECQTCKTQWRLSSTESLKLSIEDYDAIFDSGYRRGLQDKKT